MSRIILLEDEGGPALVANSLIEIYEHEVDVASDLREFIFLFEVNRNKSRYDAVLLDLTVPGIVDYEIPGTGETRTCVDLEGMHGYKYFVDQRDVALRNYMGRIAFYTAFHEKLRYRAKCDRVDISGYKVFDKADMSAEAIHKWITKLPRFTV